MQTLMMPFPYTYQSSLFSDVSSDPSGDHQAYHPSGSPVGSTSPPGYRTHRNLSLPLATIMNMNGLCENVFMGSGNSLPFFNFSPKLACQPHNHHNRFARSLSSTSAKPAVNSSFSIESILGLSSQSNVAHLSINTSEANPEPRNSCKSEAKLFGERRQPDNRFGPTLNPVSPDSTAKDYSRSHLKPTAKCIKSNATHSLAIGEKRRLNEECFPKNRPHKLIRCGKSGAKIKVEAEEEVETEEDEEEEREEELLQNRSSSSNGHKPLLLGHHSGKTKRIRTIFTPEQLERLEGEFERQQYMVGPERQFLAGTLALTEAQVKVWFQNRRIKWRKQHLEMQQVRLAKLRQRQEPRPGQGQRQGQGSCEFDEAVDESQHHFPSSLDGNESLSSPTASDCFATDSPTGLTMSM